MKFNDTLNKDGLIQDIDFICGTDSSSYSIQDKTRNINNALYDIGVLMWQYSPLWSFDDNNQSTLPVYSTNLVDGQKDYSLETNIIHIERVSVKDKNGIFYDLEFIPFIKIPENPEEFFKENGLPKLYSLKGNSLFLFPAPKASEVTLNNGLRIYISRIADEVKFLPSDTNKEPGFNPAYHRLLSLKASIDYLIVNNPNRYLDIKNEYVELLGRFINWLQNRQLPKREQILRPRKENYE